MVVSKRFAAAAGSVGFPHPVLVPMPVLVVSALVVAGAGRRSPRAQPPPTVDAFMTFKGPTRDGASLERALDDPRLESRYNDGKPIRITGGMPDGDVPDKCDQPMSVQLATVIRTASTASHTGPL